ARAERPVPHDPRRAKTSPQRSRDEPASNLPPRSTWPWFFLILAANFLLFRMLLPGADDPVTVPYTVFKQQVVNDNVAAIYNQGQSIEGRFLEAVTYPADGEAALTQEAPTTAREPARGPAGALE